MAPAPRGRPPRARAGGRGAGPVPWGPVSIPHAGPSLVFSEEAHEDSADLLFLPEATASDWAVVFSHAEVRRIPAGLALLQAGEQDRALYLLTEGTVGVRLPRDEGAFKTIDAASVGGERALFDGRPRSATPAPG